MISFFLPVFALASAIIFPSFTGALNFISNLTVKKEVLELEQFKPEKLG
jgi:hypothetical protein